MKYKAQGNDLYPGLKAEHTDEVRFCLLLQVQSKR